MANKGPMNAKINVNFTDSSGTGTDLYLVSGENLSTSLGKVSKFIKDNQGGGGGSDLAEHIAKNVEDNGGVHGICVSNGQLKLWNEYTQQWLLPSQLGYALNDVSGLNITQGDLSLTITWSDPPNRTSATWAGTKLVMNVGAYPEDVTDGTLLVNSKTRDAYKTNGFTVNNLVAGTTYYFKLFPYTDKGVITNNDINGKKAIAVDVTEDWNVIQNKVRNNNMSDISLGEQYTCGKTLYGPIDDSTILTWDVIGKNVDTPYESNLSHSLTLRTHFVQSDAYYIPFSSKEACYACLTSALSAGTYYFKWGTNAYFTFTLTQSVPVGGQLVGSYGDKYIYSYSSNTSTTPIEYVQITNNSTGGTYLGEFSDTINGNLNARNSAVYVSGNNNYQTSTIRQWLNSELPRGQWWTPQHAWDRPPVYYDLNIAENFDGFMYSLDSGFKSTIGKTQVITKDSAGNTYITNDYFFLLSATQVGFSDYLGEGTKYPVYSDNNSRKGYSYSTYDGSIQNVEYLLRTLNSNNAIKEVYKDGNLYNWYPANVSKMPFLMIACNII